MRKSCLAALALLAIGLGTAACGDSGPSVSIKSHSAQAVTTTTTTPEFPPGPTSTSSTTSPPGTPAFQAVTYHGVRFQVPGSWPVYDLTTDTTRCVRYDQNAVFEGAQGAKPNCPARLIGRTTTVQIQPLGTGTKSAEAVATQATTVNGLTARVDPSADTTGSITVVLPDQSVLVTITFGADQAVANQIFQSLHAG